MDHLLDEAFDTQYAYTHKIKNDTLPCLEHLQKMIWDAIWLLHLDGERTLGSDFDTLGLIITLRATSFSF